jgi:hypothetical protein
VLVKLRRVGCQYSVSALLFAFTFSHMSEYVKTTAFFNVTPCGTFTDVITHTSVCFAYYFRL